MTVKDGVTKIETETEDDYERRREAFTTSRAVEGMYGAIAGLCERIQERADDLQTGFTDESLTKQVCDIRALTLMLDRARDLFDEYEKYCGW